MARLIAIALLLLAGFPANAQAPKPLGKMVPLGGHRLHVYCTGKGAPTVVVEPGFDEFSSDWALVQTAAAKFTRVCTYDRAGYAWSEPGPKPRTYDQINLDLHLALHKLGEKGPYVLVGHSFGGPVIHNYALRYRQEVAGLVFAESVGAAHRIIMGKKTARIADFAQKKPIPEPHDSMLPSDKPSLDGKPPSPEALKIEPPYDKLSPELQQAHVWAMAQRALNDAENSEREWSSEYLAQWLASEQKGSLGDLPIIVLARKEGGYGNDHDVSAEELERQRRAEHEEMAAFSSRGKLLYVDGGHEQELEAPEAVTEAIHEIVETVRAAKHHKH